MQRIALALDAAPSPDPEYLQAWIKQTTWLGLSPGADELRSGTLAALRILRQAASDFAVASAASSPLNRSAALNRAGATLKHLLDSGAVTCPEPEWPIIETIAWRWQASFIEAGGEIGRQVLREPVLNPYEGYSGLPVIGPTFVGRRDILSQIETRLATGELLPVLILYGHRRMGKTSILRNLETVFPAGTLLVYLDMQDVAMVDSTGELLLDLADAIHARALAAGLDPGPAPAPDRFDTLSQARRALNALLDQLAVQMTAGRRLILAVDEFEIIEERISQGRIDPDLLRYLRALNQKHRWLALVFGGLHTLNEMGGDYRAVFYGQADHLRVSYLSRDDAYRLITQPHPDFALDYSPRLCRWLYRLTYGQPYLLQRLCWELVNRWNERFLKEGEATPRTLQVRDLEPVLSADFYASAEYYFDGVWSNISPAERALLSRLATRKKPWRRQALEAGDDGSLADTLERLKGHDVVVVEAGGIRIASELMRRWTCRYQPPVQGTNAAPE